MSRPGAAGIRLPACVLSLALLWLPLSIAGASDAPIDSAQYERLRKFIQTTPVESFDLKTFETIYQTYSDAPKMLKTILGESGHNIPEKSKRLGELRKFHDWTIQGEYARDKNVIIENTNQGKDNGARSDLDATASVLDLEASGDRRLRPRGVKELREYHRGRYISSGFAEGSETVDVSLFNGDAWLPDWRDIHLGYQEFNHRLMRNVLEIRRVPDAYFVPGAHKEQAHDRALAEGHTIHIGWDFVNNMPAVNGLPIEFDPKTGRVVQLEVDPNTGKILEPQKKITLVEYNTRDAAKLGVVKRYGGITELHGPDKWRRSFGNLIQNWYQALTHSEPISHNKYFIERIVDQAINRVTNVNGTYVEIEKSGASENIKKKWKKNFIERGFGVKEGTARFEEIKSVLDRSARMQIDYKANRPFDAPSYFADEIPTARKFFADQGFPETTTQAQKEALILKKAEALFIGKQRMVTIDGYTKVIDYTFRMEFTPEGLRRASHDFRSPEVARKIMHERAIELALFFDMVETAPLEAAERTRIRQKIIESIPRETRPLALRMAELARLKMDLIGRSDVKKIIAGERSHVMASEIYAEAEAEIRKLLGNVDTSPLARRGEILRYIDQTILMSLGPVEAAEYAKALEASTQGARLKYAGLAYWNEMKAHADLMWGTMAALAMVNSYQQHCADQISWSSDCVGSMAHEGFVQVLFLMPYINTGMMITDGAKAMGRGETLHGAIGLGMGLASVPMVAEGLGFSGAVAIKLYVVYMTAKLGVAVTYGYSVQLMESDFSEQAFKAIPVPGKQAAAYEHRNRPTFFKQDTPTFPILSDLIEVEADRWSSTKRGQVARGLFSADIQADLLEMGVDPASTEWDRRAREVAHTEYGPLVPYTMRMARIYEAFSPKVNARLDRLRPGNPDLAEDFLGLGVCMEVKQEGIEARYAEPPGVWDQLRFWADRGREREIEIAAAWGTCVDRTVKEDRDVIQPVFEEYVDAWFANQSSGYQLWNKTDERRNALVRALMNEYVVHRHMHEEQEERTSTLMREAMEQGKREAERRGKILSSLMTAEKDSTEELQEQVQADWDSALTSVGDPDVEPELRIVGPASATRLCTSPTSDRCHGAPVDVSARGRYEDPTETVASGPDKWQASLSSQITSVTLGEPPNLVNTQELQEELEEGRGPEAKRFVTIEETLSAELKDESDTVRATADTTLTHYEVLEWGGDLTVETRAANADTTDPEDREQTSPYAGALITVSGPASGEEVSVMGIGWAGASFSDLEAGGYSIQVAPREGDERHETGTADAELIDFTPALGTTPAADSRLEALTIPRSDPENAEAQLVLVTWKDRDTLTVVLPYKAPEEEPDASDDSEGSGDGDTPVDLSDLLEAMRRASNSATEAGDEATVSCEEAARRATETETKVRDLTGRITGVGGQVGGIEASIARLTADVMLAQEAMNRANATARELATLRDQVAAARDKACGAADRIAETSDRDARTSLVAEASTAAAEAESLGAQADRLSAEITRNIEAIREIDNRAATLLDQISDLRTGVSRLEEPAITAADAIAGARASTASAEAAVGEVRTSEGQGAEILEEGATRAETAPPEATEPGDLMRQLGELFGTIRTTLDTVADCPEEADREVVPVEDAVAQARTDIGLLDDRLATLEAGLADGDVLEQIQSIAAEAEGLMVLVDAFTESIHNRVAEAAECATRAENAALEPTRIEVPDLIGKSERLATAWLGDLGLNPVVLDITTAGAGRAPDSVDNQAPRHPASLAPGEPVTLWVYRAPAAAPPPEAPTEEPPPPAPPVTQAECTRLWPGTVLTTDASGNPMCACPNAGTAWSKVQKRCLDLGGGGGAGLGTTPTSDCSHKPGTLEDPLTGECRCPVGTWDGTVRRCVDTAAADREREIEEGVKGAECEYLLSQIEVFRLNPDRLSQQMAERATNEAREKGCDADRIAAATPPAGGSGSGGDGTPVPVTEPVEDKDEGEVNISTRNINACVTDVNDVLDDQYDLIVNGNYVGSIAHPEGGATCYNTTLRSGPNRLELRLVATRGKGTYLLFTLNDGEFSTTFGGSSNHVWNVIAP